MEGHNGIDIMAPWDTPMVAVVDGIIGDVKNAPEGYGKHLRLYREIEGKAVIEEWTYGHCSEILVRTGDAVKAGEVIAKTGNAGFVVSGATPYWKHNPYAGTHLHPGKRYHGAWSGTGPYTHIGGSLRTTGPLDYYKGFFGSVDFSEELGAAASATDTPEAAQKRLTLKSLYNQLSVIISNQRRS